MRYKPINDYQTKDDLFKRLGIKERKPRIGNVGRAIIEASKHHRSVNWLKKQLDVYFDKLRGDRDRKDETKGRKRHPH